MPNLETLKLWLAQAYDAQHRLMLGEQEAELSHTIVGTQTVKFTATDPDKMERHIRWLEDLIARAKGRGRRSFYGC